MVSALLYCFNSSKGYAYFFNAVDERNTFFSRYGVGPSGSYLRFEENFPLNIKGSIRFKLVKVFEGKWRVTELRLPSGYLHENVQRRP